MNIKVFLIFVLLVAFLGYWLLPKSKWARRLKMSESLFYGMNIIGVVAGVIGLIASLTWTQAILTHHYFEFILLPVLVVYLYSGILKKVKNEEIYDEKQIHDMTHAAAIAGQGSSLMILMLYALYKENILHGLVWFPIYIFFTLAVYSASALFYFRKT